VNIWSGAVNTLWSNAGNWSKEVVPTAGATVLFNSTSTAASTLDAGFAGSINKLYIDTGYTGTLTQGSALAVNDAFFQAAGTFTDASPLSHAFTVGGSFSVPYAAAGTFNRYTGAGDSTDPYMIRDVYDLQAMKNHLTSYFRMNASLDATAVSDWNGGLGFDPIGDATHTFTGTLDGNGKVVTNLAMHRTGQDYVGLFGSIGAAGVVSEFGLEKVSSYGGNYIGGLAGLSAGTLSNVYTTGSFTVSGVNFVGGLVGGNTGSIANAYSSARVVGTDTVGGLAGSNTGTIDKAYAMGHVTGTTNTGGLVGDGTPGLVTNSFWNEKMTGQATSDGGTAGKVIRVTGATDADGYAVLNAEDVADPDADMMSSDTYSGWDFGSTWVMDEGGSFPHFQYRYPEGVRGVWGITYNGDDGGTPTADWEVGLYVSPTEAGSGTQVDTTKSTADGMYYFVMGTNDVQATDWVIGKIENNALTGNTRVKAETRSIMGLDIWGTLARSISHVYKRPADTPPIKIKAPQEAQEETNRSLASLTNNIGQIAPAESAWGKAADVQIEYEGVEPFSVPGIETELPSDAGISFYDEGSAPGREPVPTFTLTRVGTQTKGIRSGSTKSVMLEIAEELMQSPKGHETSGNKDAASASAAGGETAGAAAPATGGESDGNADAADQKASAKDEQTDESTKVDDKAVPADEEQAAESQAVPEKEAANAADRGAKEKSSFFNDEAKKFLTDVRVVEGAVYVVDSVSEVSFLTPGESIRVSFKDHSAFAGAKGTASGAGISDKEAMPLTVVKADPPTMAVKADPPPLMAVKDDLSMTGVKADLSTVSVKINPPETVEKADLPVVRAEPPPTALPPEPKDMVTLALSAVVEPDSDGARYGTLKNPGKNVFIKCQGGEWQAATDGMVILPGDELRTAAQSSVEVLLDGGKVGHLEIKEGSLFRINKAGIDPATGDKTTLLDLAVGKMLIQVEKLKGNSRFEVRTPTALTGVRGTIFEIIVKEKA
jgi:hypothetical protein